MSELVNFQTSDLGNCGRLEGWLDAINPMVGSFDVCIENEESFDANVQYAQLGASSFSRISATAHKVIRTHQLIKQDERDNLKLALMIDGQGHFEQGENRHILMPGDWTIYDTASPYIIASDTTFDMLLLEFPRRHLDDGHFPFRRILAQRFPGNNGINKLISKNLLSTFEELPNLTHQTEMELADNLVRFMRLGLLDQLSSHPRETLTETMRERIRLHIDRNLDDPNLSVDSVAAHLNCSKRYLHKMFAEHNTTISNYIWLSRLKKCRADLADPKHAHKSIIEIAFSWGFNSAPHFSRAFKNEYGVSPRETRRG